MNSFQSQHKFEMFDFFQLFMHLCIPPSNPRGSSLEPPIMILLSHILSGNSLHSAII